MRKVVITGGPGAGKTALLETVRHHFCEHVAVLRESASILYGGGFPRDPSAVTKCAAQRAIYHVQRELERIIEEQGLVNLALCDRGTLDGLAYWPGAPEAWFADLETTIEREFARYEAVIHLRTPNGHNGYNHQNPLRVESANEAHVIDKRIAEIWSRHPNYTVVEARHSFLDKVARAAELIQVQIPPCAHWPGEIASLQK